VFLFNKEAEKKVFPPKSSKKFINNKVYFHTSTRLNMDINSLLELMPIEDYTKLIEPVVSTLKQAKAAYESSAYHFEMKSTTILENKSQFLSEHYLKAKSALNQAEVSERQGNFFWKKGEEGIDNLRNTYGTPTMERLEARHAEKKLDSINSAYARAYEAREVWMEAASNQIMMPHSTYSFTDR
jgi:hypothetical protein